MKIKRKAKLTIEAEIVVRKEKKRIKALTRRVRAW